jgi:hypothetical protein
MLTKTMRVYPDDEQRARVLATMHHESGADFYHRVLDYWIENNRDEASRLFQNVQSAVLSNDRERLRAVFHEAADAMATEDAAYLEGIGR